MQATIDVTNRRRTVQQEYNVKHGITPTTVVREIGAMPMMEEDVYEMSPKLANKLAKELPAGEVLSLDEIRKRIKEADRRMKRCAKELSFEEAGKARDEMRFYQELELSFS